MLLFLMERVEAYVTSDDTELWYLPDEPLAVFFRYTGKGWTGASHTGCSHVLRCLVWKMCNDAPCHRRSGKEISEVIFRQHLLFWSRDLWIRSSCCAISDRSSSVISHFQRPRTDCHHAGNDTAKGAGLTPAEVVDCADADAIYRKSLEIVNLYFLGKHTVLCYIKKVTGIKIFNKKGAWWTHHALWKNLKEHYQLPWQSYLDLLRHHWL